MTSDQREAIKQLIAHAEDSYETRNVNTETCDDCGADAGEHCDESCGRAAMVLAIETARQMLVTS